MITSQLSHDLHSWKVNVIRRARLAEIGPSSTSTYSQSMAEKLEKEGIPRRMVCSKFLNCLGCYVLKTFFRQTLLCNVVKLQTSHFNTRVTVNSRRNFEHVTRAVLK